MPPHTVIGVGPPSPGWAGTFRIASCFPYLGFLTKAFHLELGMCDVGLGEAHAGGSDEALVLRRLAHETLSHERCLRKTKTYISE